MGIFKKLFGKSNTDAGWNVRPAEERPAAWAAPKKVSRAEPPPTQPKERNPFLDDEMLDTLQLEAETQHEDNPYQTHSWEMDPENDTRKLRTIPFSEASKKPESAAFNPYDTGEHRRGWKN